MLKVKLVEKTELTEMARIGFTEDGYEVYVWTDDAGKIPHFHYRTKDKKTFNSCIKIEVPEYFFHKGKEDTLNSKQRKMLINFLKSNDVDSPGDTHWTSLIKEWNRNNSDIRISIDTPMPDYTQLKIVDNTN